MNGGHARFRESCVVNSLIILERNSVQLQVQRQKTFQKASMTRLVAKDPEGKPDAESHGAKKSWGQLSRRTLQLFAAKNIARNVIGMTRGTTTFLSRGFEDF